MILEREQINRYLRHIIMPEISGQGQKKLLESTVFICGENVQAAAPVIYYLAASGIGQINCCFKVAEGFDKLAAGIRDLNSDVSISLAGGKASEFRIFLGGPEFIGRQSDKITTDFVPVIIACYNGWQGVIGIYQEQAAANTLLAALAAGQPPAAACSNGKLLRGLFAFCFAGALCAMEVVKLALAIGQTPDGLLTFNLLSMEFNKISQQDSNRMAAALAALRSACFPAINLAGGRALIVGAGGLGSPAAYALAAAGIGTIGLVDYDTVEISNLNRQILHTTSRIGMPKVESAAIFLKGLNPQLIVNRYNTGLTKENVYDILADYHVVIVAVDNFPTRFLLNDACFFAGKPMLDAGVIRFDGTAMTITTPAGHCYRCTLPEIPSGSSTPACSETGVLGSLPGIMGFIQAAEAAKLLSGQGQLLNNRLIYFNGLSSSFGTMTLIKPDNCALCGTNPTIFRLQDYDYEFPR